MYAPRIAHYFVRSCRSILRSVIEGRSSALLTIATIHGGSLAAVSESNAQPLTGLVSALHKEVIQAVSVVRERGVYAPMTSSGDLLANDIYVSCHNVVKTSTLSQTFLGFMSRVQRKVIITDILKDILIDLALQMRSIFGGAEDGHLPTTTEFFLNIIDHIIPTDSKVEL